MINKTNKNRSYKIEEENNNKREMKQKKQQRQQIQESTQKKIAVERWGKIIGSYKNDFWFIID